MFTVIFKTSILLLGFISFFMSFDVLAVTYPYLEDADTTPTPSAPSGSSSIEHHLYPRLMLGDSTIKRGDFEDSYARYHILANQSSGMKTVARIQKKYPDLMYFRLFSPRATQEYELNTYCSQKGIPFEGNSAATGGCKIFPGHWLYRAGKKTTQWTSATASKIYVSNAKDFTVGRYVVIYDLPVASFKNAEHVKIISKDVTQGSITVQRGYKSKLVAHPYGSIVAQHVIGQGGGDARNWAYNLSSKCPRDANGKQIGVYMAQFLRDHLQTSWDGDFVDINVSGILFDADYHFELKSKLADVNNDLVTDHGISPTGKNWYGEGINLFYSKVRLYFPDLYLSGGTAEARGDGILGGTQFEGWLTGFKGAPVDYSKVDQQFSNYMYKMHHQAGPVMSNGLLKQGTKIHPADGKSNSNSIFRLALGGMLLEDGYFGHNTTEVEPDTWYDEYAVDVDPGSPDYGRAITSNLYDITEALKHRGWLGRPLGPRKRIYNEKFAPNKSLISNATFDANLNGWTGTNVKLSRITGNPMDGSGALYASMHTTYQKNVYGASIKGPAPTLVAGKEYSLTFSARAPVMREISSTVGSVKQRFLIGPGWRRYVMTFKAAKSGTQRISFQVGMENTEVFLDTVHLFAGNANIFRRDFENGIVIVNATPSSKTVDLGDVFQKIRGAQAPVFNNGASVSSVTLARYDAILLVRRENSASPAPAPNPDDTAGNECGVPNYSISSTEAIYLWKDCQGDGSWHFRITGGGSTVGAVYQGDVTSSKAFNNVTGYSLESSDILDTGNSNKFTYTLKAWNNAEDGVDFSFPLNSNVCFAATTHSRVFLGAGRVATALPLDLGTLLKCGASAGPQPGDECGTPSYDTRVERGAFLWKDCTTTNTWHLNVSAGGSSTTVEFQGNITSPDPVSFSAFSIESSDDIDTSNKRNISFILDVVNTWQDKLNFNISSSGGCLNISGGKLFLGTRKIPVNAPIDLINLGACQ